MKAAKKKSSAKNNKLTDIESNSDLAINLAKGIREGTFFITIAVALYLLLSLASYSTTDPGWSRSLTTTEIVNLGGISGAWFSDVFLLVFGILAYLFPLMIGWGGWLLFTDRKISFRHDPHRLALYFAGMFFTLASGSGFASLHFDHFALQYPDGAGGILGQLIDSLLVAAFSNVGASIFLLAIFFTGISMVTGLSWLLFMEQVGKATLVTWNWILFKIHSKRLELQAKDAREEREGSLEKKKKKLRNKPKPHIESHVANIEQSHKAEQEKQLQLFPDKTEDNMPPLSLLRVPDQQDGSYSEEALEAISRLVELKLQDFNIEVSVVEVQPGPVITSFELELAAGVKASRITSLSTDLARSLSVTSVRVVEVIPGKSVVGIEIPNERRETVWMSEIISSKEFDKSKSPLTFALGKDISGSAVIANLAKMPHLLVAGTTGSGKSVSVNTMIISLLYKATPEEVRMIMIDPKMLELSVYEGIPHLLAPVVTDMQEAANALRWCVKEMDRRYQLMSALGVRSLSGYNKKIEQAEKDETPILDPLHDEELRPGEAEALTKIPTIVVIVDEFADMMMVVGKKVEELIVRIAQKARAAGIHLVLATQRPSVDVITGLIKSNVPTRMAFQVSSRTDSRVILDQQGAEHLLGKGDMLYLKPGAAIPTRVHGAFITDIEVHNVVDNLKIHSEPNYIEEILQTSEDDNSPGSTKDGRDSELDPLYDEAVHLVTESRKASITYVQRRLRVGYNRAASMIEAMESAGIVSTQKSNGNREVLANPPV